MIKKSPHLKVTNQHLIVASAVHLDKRRRCANSLNHWFLLGNRQNLCKPIQNSMILMGFSQKPMEKKQGPWVNKQSTIWEYSCDRGMSSTANINGVTLGNARQVRMNRNVECFAKFIQATPWTSAAFTSLSTKRFCSKVRLMSDNAGDTQDTLHFRKFCPKSCAYSIIYACQLSMIYPVHVNHSTKISQKCGLWVQSESFQK